MDAEDLRQLLDQLEATAPVRLVGHDIGGMVASSFARLHPNPVARLALLDLALPGLGLEQAMDVANGGLRPPGLPAERRGCRPGRRTTSGRTRLEASFGHYRTLLDDGEVNRAWADRDRGTLPMPVLAAGGERTAGSQLADALRAVAPQVEGHVVAGAGHFVIKERPEELLALLQDFLKDRT